MRLLTFLISFAFVFSFSTLAAFAENRIALVIGNADYEAGSKLDNPVNDAELMAQTLSHVGFQVTKIVNANRFDMRKAMLDYSRRLTGVDTIGVFYYAGHGMQVDGQNYLLPIDASPARKDELALHGVALSEFLRTLNSVSGSEGRLNVVILDACRNNPFARGWRSAGRGLATIDAPSGTLIAFATAPGDVAADGDGVNSPYTKALAQMIKKPGLAIEQTFKGARNLVWKWTKKTGKAQVPWESTSLRGDFYFTPGQRTSVSKEPNYIKPLIKEPLIKEIKKSETGSEKVSVLGKTQLNMNKQNKNDCKIVGSSLKQAITVQLGDIICSENRKHKAVIDYIRKRAVVYSVDGEKSVVCTIKDLCQFNWPGAPLFGVEVKRVKAEGIRKHRYVGVLTGREQ